MHPHPASYAPHGTRTRLLKAHPCQQRLLFLLRLATCSSCSFYSSFFFSNTWVLDPYRRGAPWQATQGQSRSRDGAAVRWGLSRRRDPFKAALGARGVFDPRLLVHPGTIGYRQRSQGHAGKRRLARGGRVQPFGELRNVDSGASRPTVGLSSWLTGATLPKWNETRPK